jgi:hypothetical protein
MAGDASFEIFSVITVFGVGYTEIIGASDESAPLLVALQVSGVGVTASAGTGVVQIPMFKVAAGGQGVTVSLGALDVSGQGIAGEVGDSASGGIALSTTIQPVGLGIAGRVGRGSISLGGLDVWANSHDNLSELAPVDVTAQGSVGYVGTLEIEFQPFGVEGSGKTEILGRGTINLGSVFVSGQGLRESEGIGSVGLRRLIVSGNGLVGRVGSGSIEIPFLDIESAGSAKVIGSAYVEIYPLQVDGFGETEILAPVFRTITLNTRINAASEYTNFGFNSMCVFNGMHLVASEAGIYAVAGDTDDGVAITSRVKSGITDLDSTEYKRISQLYIHGTMDSGLTLSLTTEDGEERKYRVTQENERVKVLRFLTGRGVYSRNWQWGLEGRFKVEQLAMEVEPLPRRIR